MPIPWFSLTSSRAISPPAFTREARKRKNSMDDLSALQKLLDESSDPANPTANEIKEVMDSVRTIAVIGISRDPQKAARRVPAYLAAKGYQIIPINPFVDELLGIPTRKSLDDLSEPVDMVLVFRPSAEATEITRLAMKRVERPVIWLQEGIWGGDAASEARNRGLTVVQNMCTYKVHKVLEEA